MEAMCGHELDETRAIADFQLLHDALPVGFYRP
jgi:hypothetical protein